MSLKYVNAYRALCDRIESQIKQRVLGAFEAEVAVVNVTTFGEVHVVTYTMQRAGSTAVNGPAEVRQCCIRDGQFAWDNIIL